MDDAHRSRRWMLVGALAVIGGYWIIVYALIALKIDNAYLPYVAHALAAGTVGSIMMMHAPFRPWREPTVAAVGGIATMAVLILTLPHASFGWVASRSPHPWLIMIAIAALSAASAIGGAMLVRRRALTRPGTPALVVLSAMVLTGVAVVTVQALVGIGLGDSGLPLMLVLSLASVIAGGFITQSVIAERRVWACGSGVALLALTNVHSVMDVLGLAIGVPIGLAIASIGPRAYWWWFGPAVEPEQPTLPPAQLQ